MPNPYFRFKQFIVYHDKCGQKVSTDACIFGAWCSQRISLSHQHLPHVLDIGTGSGLLSLMIAQRLPSVNIDAIEIDFEAAKQAQQNITNSPWASTIRLFHNSIQEYTIAQEPELYDYIVSNPPFFPVTSTPSNNQRQIASHTFTLDFDELLDCTQQLLRPEGRFYVLLPYLSVDDFIERAISINIHVSSVLHIRDREDQACHRSCLEMRRASNLQTPAEILIMKNRDGAYTDDFLQLLKPYYLYL